MAAGERVDKYFEDCDRLLSLASAATGSPPQGSAEGFPSGPTLAKGLSDKLQAEITSLRRWVQKHQDEVLNDGHKGRLAEVVRKYHKFAITLLAPKAEVLGIAQVAPSGRSTDAAPGGLSAGVRASGRGQAFPQTFEQFLAARDKVVDMVVELHEDMMKLPEAKLIVIATKRRVLANLEELRAKVSGAADSAQGGGATAVDNGGQVTLELLELDAASPLQLSAMNATCGSEVCVMIPESLADAAAEIRRLFEEEGRAIQIVARPSASVSPPAAAQARLGGNATARGNRLPLAAKPHFATSVAWEYISHAIVEA